MTWRRLAVAWTVLIVAACLVPGDRVPEVELRLLSPDKVVHVGMFFLFGWLWMRATPPAAPASWPRTGAVVAGGVALAVAIEVAQDVLPINRFGDPYDAVADLAGLALGVGLGLWQRRSAGRGGAGAEQLS